MADKKTWDDFLRRLEKHREERRKAIQEAAERGMPTFEFETPALESARQLIAQTGRNILAGVGDFLTGAAAAGDWMQHHPLLGVPPEARTPIPSPLDVMRAAAGWAGPRLSGVGTEPVPFEGARSLVDPAYLATAGARALGGSLPLMIGGAAAGAVFRSAHPVVQALVAGGASRALEGSIEAGGVFEEALARGMSPEEAAVAAGRTFAANLGLTGVDAAQFALSFLPLGRPAATAVGRTAQAAGRVAGAAATEAAEEGVQEAIQRWALRDPIALDPQMQEALALGGLLGGAFGAAGQITQAVAPDLMRARPDEAVAPTPAGAEAPAPAAPPVETAAGPVPEVLRPFAGRRLTRFELSRLPVEQQRAIRDALTEENANLLQITVAPAARKYLDTRFPAEFEPLVSAWEAAGVPNEVIARTVERTDPQSLRKRQQRLERQGLVDLPMYQPGRWVRVRAGETDFSTAQRAFVDAGRPRGLLDMTRIEEAVPVVTPAPEPETAAPAPAVPPAEPQRSPAQAMAAVRRSLQDTGSAQVGEHVIRIVPHPEASGRTLDSYAVEWTAPDGSRSLRPTPPLTIEAAMDEALRTARTITGAPAEAPAKRARPARPAPQTAPPAQPAAPPAPAPATDIREGDVVYGGDGRSYRVLDVSHPKRLEVIREQDGRRMFVPRAAMRKEPPPSIAPRPQPSEPAPAPDAPAEPGFSIASWRRGVEEQIMGALQQAAGEPVETPAAPTPPPVPEPTRQKVEALRQALSEGKTATVRTATRSSLLTNPDDLLITSDGRVMADEGRGRWVDLTDDMLDDLLRQVGLEPGAPAPETPAPETPAPETPAPETPAPDPAPATQSAAAVEPSSQVISELLPEEQELLNWMSLSIRAPGGFRLSGHTIRVVNDGDELAVEVTPPGGEPGLLPGRFETLREAYEVARHYAANVLIQERQAQADPSATAQWWNSLSPEDREVVARAAGWVTQRRKQITAAGRRVIASSWDEIPRGAKRVLESRRAEFEQAIEQARAGDPVETPTEPAAPTPADPAAPTPAPSESAAPEPLPTFQPRATGAEATVRTERGTPVSAQYAVVEARDLITSHDTALRPDPRFPQELQPRDRTRAASELQIIRIAQELQPEFLGESPRASEGAPIVGPDGIVESGNARVIALKRLAEQGHPNLQRYREWLTQNAERFGLDPVALEGMQAPVLVRVRRSDVDRVSFVQEANEPAVAAMSATEQAVADARAMSEGLLARFVPSETGELNIASNRDFISAFINEVVAPADRPRFILPEGGVSAEGLTRIRNALFARAYGDADIIMRLAEDPDSNVRNITGAMLNVAPRFAIIKDRIAEGSLHNLDITQDMAQAANKLSSLRQTGQTVETYLAQTTLFADDMSPMAKAILEVFDHFARSRKRLTEVFQTYAAMVEAAGHPGQVSLLGEVQVPTREAILRAAVEEVDARYAGQVAGQTRLEVFEGGPEGGRPDSATLSGVETPPAETRGLPAAAAEPRAAHERPGPSDDTPVITRKQAIDYIEREFLMPVREGRLRFRGSRGEFNLRTHVTRLRRAEDFRALTHEFGHFLSETLDLKPENYPELQPLGAALYPDADVALQHEEGAAEFFYLYFSRPEEARAAAPAFYADFEERLRREAGLGAKIRQAQKLLMAQFNQTGTAAVKAAIVREEAKDRPFLTAWQRFYAQWIDDLHPIWQAMKHILGEQNITSEWDVEVSQNPYILGRLARGRWAKAHTLLTRAQLSPDFERIGPSFKEILQPVTARIEDFEAYLVAKRAIELHERGINPGVSLEDARAAVRELESPEFQKAQQQLVDYQNNLIDHLVDAGVLDQQTADTFRELNRDYVPFYRYFGEETMSGGLAGSRLKWGNLPKPIKAIRGSTRSIMSPLQSIMRNTFVMIDIAERNRAARALVELADQATGVGWLIEHVPTPMEPNNVALKQLRKALLEAGIPADVLKSADLDRLAVTFNPVGYARIKENRENILTVYRNGRPEFYQLHPELYRAMQFVDQPASNWLFRLLTTPTRMLRAGAVINPEFALRNPVRDQFAAMMHRKYRFAPVIDPARAIFQLIKGEAVGGDQLYDLWQAAGGAQSTLVSLNREYLEKDLRRLLGQRTPWERAAAIIRSPLTALEFISQALEESTRLAQFRRGIETEGMTPEGIRRAAYASREVSVDFQRAGSLGRQANQVKAFFNAAIQGVDQMARLWKQDPLGYTLRAFAMITLPSVALYLINRDDPRYQELPRWRRDLFWVFLGEDSVTFVPKPFELGVLFGTLPERILEWVLENDPEAFRGFEQTLFDTMLPVNPTNPVDFLPDALMPMVEVWANREVFTGRPIVPRAEEGMLPAAQYGPHTTETAKAIAEFLGVSPRQVEHLVRGYGAGLGRQVLRVLDRLAGAESITPVVRPFGGDPFVSAVSLDEFYEELEQLERAQRTANELRKRGMTAQVQVNEWRLRQLRRTRDNLASLRRLRRTVLEDPRLTVEEKRRMSNDITLRMVNMARAAIGKAPIQTVPQASGM